jgi:hypothetical protein
MGFINSKLSIKNLKLKRSASSHPLSSIFQTHILSAKHVNSGHGPLTQYGVRQLRPQAVSLARSTSTQASCRLLRPQAVSLARSASTQTAGRQLSAKHVNLIRNFFGTLRREMSHEFIGEVGKKGAVVEGFGA